MKKINLLWILTVLVLITACSKKDNEETQTTPAPTTTAPTYFLKYKFNGSLITADSISVFRGTTTTPKTMIITGTVKNSPYLPKVQIVVAESSIGWVDGLNVTCNTSTDSYVSMRDINNAYHSTLSINTGISMFFSHLSYTANNVITGTFSGEIENVNTSAIIPITEGSFNLLIAN